MPQWLEQALVRIEQPEQVRVEEGVVGQQVQERPVVAITIVFTFPPPTSSGTNVFASPWPTFLI